MTWATSGETSKMIAANGAPNTACRVLVAKKSSQDGIRQFCCPVSGAGLMVTAIPAGMTEAAMRRLTEASDQKVITKDLIRKISDDVGNAIRRVLAIAPEPHLPVAMAAGVSAIAPLALLLDTDPKPTPDPDCLLLAGLLLARTTSPNAIEEAFKDFEILKAAGRAALAQAEEEKL